MATIQEFDYSVDLLKALLWQYNKSPNLQAILQAKQDWYNTNQTQFWEDWFTNVFNLDTCNDFGCVVWAIILGVPLNFVSGDMPKTGTPWGFDIVNLSNFDGNYNFTSQQSNGTILTTAQKRILLKLRYYQLISRGSLTQTNKMLKDLLSPFGTYYMVDNLDMTMTFVSTGPAPSWITFILTEMQVLPRPAGVKMLATINGVDVPIPVPN